MPHDKPQLRALLAERRGALDADQRRAASAAITRHLVHHPDWAAAQTVAAFASIRSEVQTQDILNAALSAGKRLVLPVTVGRGHRLVLRQVLRLDDLVPGSFRVPEPPPTAQEVHPNEVDLFVVPGLGFDLHGNRLGYGAGYYDRTLAAAPQARRVAICFACQIVDALPAEAHDQPMHAVITENGVTRHLRR